MFKKSNILKLSVSAGAIAAITLSGNAFAQEAGSKDEIIVTARKKEETLLEAPLAITAFAEQKIEDLGLGDINDIQLFTPGFVTEGFATTPGRFDQSPRFRGIDIDTGDPFRQTASVFVDGLYVINGANGIRLNDVQRVEVIKGPQSAVYGRNTFGGAVNYISKTPGDVFAGDISASVATREDYEIEGGIETPIIPGVLSGRIGAAYHFDGGHYTNESTSGLGEDLGEEENISVSGTLFFTPSDKLEVKLRAAYFENEDGAPASTLVPSSALNCGPFTRDGMTGRRASFCGNLPIPAPTQNTDRPAAFFDNLDSFLALGDGRDRFGFDRQNLTLGGSFDFDILENVTLSGLFGHAEEDTNLLFEFSASDSSPFQFSSANNREFRMNSQEVRLSGLFLDDRLEWSVGVSHFDQSSTNSGGFIFGDNVSTTPRNINFENVETTGVFGSLGFAITDKLSVTAEARYQEDKIIDDNDIATGDPVEGEFTNFLPRFILDYQATPSTLVYASYSEGNNPGGFNNEVSALDAANLAALLLVDPLAADTFDEEGLDSYEVGTKSRFFDGRATIQAAAFFMKRNGQQFRTSVTNPTVNGGATVTYFLNRGTSDIKGFEVEGDIQLNDHFNLGGTFGFVDAEFQVVADTVFADVFGSQDASGQKAPRFPKYSGSVNALLEHDFGTGLPLYVRADAAFVGKRAADITGLPIAANGAIINARIGMKTDDYRFELFVKNLSDSDVPTAANRTSDSSTFFSTNAYRIGLRDRRQFGARFSANF